MIIYLIRHGQSTGDLVDAYGGIYNDPLTDTGKSQAQSLADKLNTAGIQKIYTSPMLRARQTAEILGQSLELDIEPVLNLREINHYGLLTGAPKDIAKIYYPDLTAAVAERTNTIIDAEPYDQFLTRVLPTRQEITSTDYQTIAVVAHGGRIRTIHREILQQ